MARSGATQLFTEAAEASDVVDRARSTGRLARDAAVARLRQVAPRLIATCARGSSDCAATYVKYLVETRLRIPTFSQAPSIGSIFDATSPHLQGSALLAISQSGRSPDLLSASRQAKEVGALLLAMVNDTTSPLASLADITLPLRAGAETSVAATKSFIATLATTLDLVAEWAEADDLRTAVASLPADLALAWEQDWSAAAAPLVATRGLFVLGRGLTLGVAQEAALKFKETCGIHAEPFSTAEVAHGPAALVGSDLPVLVFPPGDASGVGMAALISGFQQRGALTIVVGEGFGGDIVLPIDPHLTAATAPLAAVQSFYRLVNTVALARGRDPDRPPFLQKVTCTL